MNRIIQKQNRVARVGLVFAHLHYLLLLLHAFVQSFIFHHCKDGLTSQKDAIFCLLAFIASLGIFVWVFVHDHFISAIKLQGQNTVMQKYSEGMYCKNSR